MSTNPNENEDIVWVTTVDQGTWMCRVVRVDDSHGNLTVTHLGNGDVIVDENVGLAYGALFGPDVDDVATWEHTCITAIDKALEDKK